MQRTRSTKLKLGILQVNTYIPQISYFIPVNSIRMNSTCNCLLEQCFLTRSANFKTSFACVLQCINPVTPRPAIIPSMITEPDGIYPLLRHNKSVWSLAWNVERHLIWKISINNTLVSKTSQGLRSLHYHDTEWHCFRQTRYQLVLFRLEQGEIRSFCPSLEITKKIHCVQSILIPAKLMLTATAISSRNYCFSTQRFVYIEILETSNPSVANSTKLKNVC